MDSSLGNPTYTFTVLSKEEIIENHKSVLASFDLKIRVKDCDLPLLYWILKLHQNPYKQRFIAGSSKCTTKILSQLLTTILTTVKTGLQKYSDTFYSRTGINERTDKHLIVWISPPL